MRVSHMCWPSAWCMYRRFSELPHFCLWFPGQRNGSNIHIHSHCTKGVWPHTWSACRGLNSASQVCLTSAAGLPVVCCGVFSFHFSSFCQCLHWSPFDLPFRAKLLPSAAATMWKVSEQILSLTQLSLHWSDLHHRGRGDLKSQCTILIYQMKWGKESKVSECPCCLQAAEPSRLSMPKLLKNSFSSQLIVSVISSCSPLRGRGNMLAFIARSKRVMSIRDKRFTRTGNTYAAEISFL